MVGGNLPGITRTVSIAIYDSVQSLQFAAANRTAFALVVFSFVDTRGGLRPHAQALVDHTDFVTCS